MKNRLTAALIALFAILGGVGLSVPAQAVVKVTTDAADPSGLGAAGLVAPPTATKANSTELRGTKVIKGLKHGVPAKKSSGGVSTNSIPSSGYLYDYAQSTPATAPTGMLANVYVLKPTGVTSNDHSLFQFSMQGGLNNRAVIVEFGIAVEPTAFPAPTYVPSNPHLFGSIWVNNSWCGSYVGSGSCVGSGLGTWVNYNDPAGDVNLGDDLNAVVGTAKRLAIVHAASGCGGTIPGGEPGWWLSYDNRYVGCFQDRIWTGASPAVSPVSSLPFSQAFWEGYKGVVGSGSCMQLGNGLFPTTTTTPTAYVGSLQHQISGTWGLSAFPNYGATYPTQFGMLALSAANTSFRGGGTETTPC